MSTAAVRIEGLTKRLGRGVLTVDDLNLVIEQGQVFGLTGPNGAGKSVTLRVLLGLVRPSAGRAWLFDQPVRPGAAVLARVGSLIDGPGFVPHLSGYDNLRLAWSLSNRQHARQDIASVLDIAGLGGAIHRPYSTYSHGMRYRLALAQAMLGSPDLLILDEPTTGLDPVHIRQVHEVVAEAAQKGVTVLLSSHRLEEVEGACTHAGIMRGGRLVAAGAISELIAAAGAANLEDAYTALVGERAAAGAEPAQP